MGLPTFEKFCCCCSLETGGIIVGKINNLLVCQIKCDLNFGNILGVVNAIFGFFGILSGITMIFLGTALMTYQQTNVDLFWWGVGKLITFVKSATLGIKTTL